MAQLGVQAAATPAGSQREIVNISLPRSGMVVRGYSDWEPEYIRDLDRRLFQNIQAEDKAQWQSIDKETGAPIDVRWGAGGGSDKDRLGAVNQWLQSKYGVEGDARFYGSLQDKDMWGNPIQHILYTNPETGKPTLLNAKSWEIGDFASIAPEIAEAAGAIGGITLGAAGGIPGIAAGAGAGGAAGSEAENLIARIVGIRPDTRSWEETGIDVAETAAFNAAAGAAGELGARALRTIARPALRRLAPPGTPTVIADLEAVGIRPEWVPSVAIQSTPVRAAVSAASKLPFSSARLEAGREQAMLAAQDYLERTFAQTGGRARTIQEGGAALQSGAQRAIDEGKQEMARLYTAVESQMPSATRVGALNTTQTLDEILSPFRGMEGTASTLGLAPLRTIQGEIAKGRGVLTWQQLKAMRTSIGQMMKGGQHGIDQGALKRVYGALSKDMDDAVAKAGPSAKAAQEQANAFASTAIPLRSQRLAPIVSRTTGAPIDPELAFRAAIAGGEGASTRIAALRQALPEDAWDEFLSARLWQMASKASEFNNGAPVVSLSQFATNWAKLGQAGREALVGGTRYAEMAPALDRLARVGQAVKDSRILENTSNTANQLFYQNLLTGGGLGAFGWFVSLEGALASLGTPYVAAKLLTSPKFMKWAARYATGTTSPTSRAAAIGELLAIGTQNPELRQATRMLAEQLKVTGPQTVIYDPDTPKNQTAGAEDETGSLGAGVLYDPDAAEPSIKPPPVGERVAGQTYQTPKGPMVWSGSGWLRPQEAAQATEILEVSNAR